MVPIENDSNLLSSLELTPLVADSVLEMVDDALHTDLLWLASSLDWD